MVHNFETVMYNNGSMSVNFREDSKQRRIIFTHGTEAYNDYIESVATDSLSVMDRIKSMRKKYKFVVNPNNKSIFRPIKRN